MPKAWQPTISFEHFSSVRSLFWRHSLGNHHCLSTPDPDPWELEADSSCPTSHAVGLQSRHSLESRETGHVKHRIVWRRQMRFKWEERLLQFAAQIKKDYECLLDFEHQLVQHVLPPIHHCQSVSHLSGLYPHVKLLHKHILIVLTVPGRLLMDADGKDLHVTFCAHCCLHSVLFGWALAKWALPLLPRWSIPILEAKAQGYAAGKPMKKTTGIVNHK